MSGSPRIFIQRVFRVMALADWHVYQILTKRAQRLREVLGRRRAEVESLRNVWIGVSVEDRRHGIPRIDELRRTPAALRFLSVEPLLEDLGTLDLDRIAWVIVGGESGPGARPMQLAWVLSVREQCRASGVPFFFKQWGGVRKGRTGRELGGRTFDEMPPHLHHAVPSLDERRRRRTLATSF